MSKKCVFKTTLEKVNSEGESDGTREEEFQSCFMRE